MGGAPQQIGPYEVLREIGRGGMGVVYLARDDKLDRHVAIKALPEELLGDEDRLTRFEREAKLLASLSHGNIASVYGLEEVDGQRYLVMEFVEGEDLSQRLKRGAIPVDEALEIAVQIAQALEAAHDKGIIHRDLKPANIKLTPDGDVKVLDFGLAKSAGDAPSTNSELANSPTIAGGSPTMPGVILGTAGYLSPEQARGRPVDKRTDIFSFGCVFYEMLAGKTIFAGETMADSLGAALHMDPNWDELPADTPPTILLLLRRCLTKDRKRRLHDIADARVEIEEAINDPSSSSLGLASAALAGTDRSSGRSGLGRVLPWVAGIILGVGGTWLAVRSGAPIESHARPMRFEIPLQTAQNNDSALLAPLSVAIAPDGSAVVIEIAGTDQPFYVRSMNSLETLVLVGTEGGSNPFFSPDGRWVGYYHSGRIMRIPREGGTPIPVCTIPSMMLQAVWLDDGTIVVRSMEAQDSLLRVRESGGLLTVFCSNETRPDLLGFDTFCSVPGQRYILAAAYTGNAVDSYTIVAISLDDGSIETIIPNGSNPAVTADGYLVYMRGSSLYTVRFDADSREVLSAETRALDSVAADQWGGTGFFALSPNGTLAYIPGKRYSVGRRLVWVDRTGELEPLPIDMDAFAPDLAISDDGKQIAVNTLRQGLELWAYDLVRNTRRSLNTEGECYTPVWDPAGRRLACLRVMAAAGYENSEIILFDLLDGSTHVLPLEPSQQSPHSWLPDGKGILFQREKALPPPQKDSDILLYRFGEEEPPETILATENSEQSPTLSHDGKWLAYVSDEAGRRQVFLRAYPDDGRKRQVSLTGVRGGWFAWAADDSELYWIADDHLFAAAIKTGPDLNIGAPETLFASPWPLADDRWAAIDVAPDGRFLMIQPADWENRVRNVRIVLNWHKQLEALTRQRSE